jgi:hypothetical protein
LQDQGFEHDADHVDLDFSGQLPVKTGMNNTEVVETVDTASSKDQSTSKPSQDAQTTTDALLLDYGLGGYGLPNGYSGGKVTQHEDKGLHERMENQQRDLGEKIRETNMAANRQESEVVEIMQNNSQ